MMPVEIADMVEDIIGIDNYLATQSGYGGFWGIDKKTRLMHAAMLAACDYAQSNHATIAATTGTLTMIAAQQATVCAVIAASAAASASST